MRIKAYLLISLPLMLMASTAGADEPTFGRSGQLAVTWDQGLGSSGVSTESFAAGSAVVVTPGSESTLDFQYLSLSGNGGTAEHFGLAPSVHYFVGDNISLGAQVLFGVTNVSSGHDVSSVNGTSSTTMVDWGVAPSVGYNIAVGDRVSIWPRVFFGYGNASTNHNGPSLSVVSLGAYVPVIFHPVNHFFLGIGPNVYTQLSVSNGFSSDVAKVTAVGLFATFGGYFLGRE
jgi:hypothetical protein